MESLDLTLKERLSFINQYLILEKLYPEEAEHYATLRKALQEGYKNHYRDLVYNLSPEMPVEDCKEVLEILSMYRAITWSYMDITGKKEIVHDYQFKGFDGNEEAEQLAYASYFIFDLDRFRELLYDKEYRDFNSHFPTLARYRRMLKVWEEVAGTDIHSKHRLNIEQIEKIVSA
ncbi:hypothetical protein C1E23_01170 [Pseudoalteromonas phenolica]|uniref:YfbU family protein n=1 Tax=Pseudoalteromonas phenolica TaxID=161398 RepID=A0A4Q7ISU0_9GAMM|nr:YfbU family protein [Pseudoalteromonas phenolica]RZQ54925.1 hypothetical protein C1E23_01170 [Pseudoalteromonas phenolica]